jgi:hypothetical protein
VLRIVAPIFPQVVVVTGDVFEFRDMASKYQVTSFPKLLFFYNGIFISAFDGTDRDPVAIGRSNMINVFFRLATTAQ